MKWNDFLCVWSPCFIMFWCLFYVDVPCLVSGSMPIDENRSGMICRRCADRRCTAVICWCPTHLVDTRGIHSVYLDLIPWGYMSCSTMGWLQGCPVFKAHMFHDKLTPSLPGNSNRSIGKSLHATKGLNAESLMPGIVVQIYLYDGFAREYCKYIYMRHYVACTCGIIWIIDTH
jgi:hypothetical protein